MAEQQRSDFTKGMLKDLYAYTLEKEKYVPQDMVHPLLFDIKTATGAFEKHTTVIGAGNMVIKPEGEQIKFGRVGEGFTVQSTWDSYSGGLEFTMEDVQDMPKEKMANVLEEFASTMIEGYMQSKENLAANVFNYGGYTAGNAIFNGSVKGNADPSGDLCYDGKPFFNLSGNLRPLYPGATATHYNGLSLGLDATNIQTAHTLMTDTNAVNSRSQKVKLMPNTLLVSPSLVWTASTLMKTAQQVNSANNNINTVQGLYNIVPWNYLTTSTFWAIGQAKKGIVFWERMPLTFDFFGDPLTGGYKATAIARFGIEVNDFRYWVGSNAPTS